MKKLRSMKELRSVGIRQFKIDTINFRLGYMNSNLKIDYDVYLKDFKTNLQRNFIWSLLQKRSLIESILIERHIPRLSIIWEVDDSIQVIDGKQRLSAMMSFVNDEFTIILEGDKYLFSQLPNDYKRVINGYNIPFNFISVCNVDEPFSDSEKVKWFSFINFAGTEQDENHIVKLKKLQMESLFKL